MSVITKVQREFWWLFLLEGIATLLLGVVAIFWPGLSLATLIVVIAGFAIAVGLVDLVYGFSSVSEDRSWWLHLVVGGLTVALAAYLLKNPDVAVGTFAALVGLLFVVRGVVDVAVAGVFSDTGNSVLSVVAGILSVVAGVVIWMYPVSGSLSFVWVLGVFAIIKGAMDIALVASAYNSNDAKAVRR